MNSFYIAQKSQSAFGKLIVKNQERYWTVVSSVIKDQFLIYTLMILMKYVQIARLIIMEENDLLSIMKATIGVHSSIEIIYCIKN